MSTAQKKAHGVLALAKLLKKSKRTAEPVVIAHRKRQFATTFWGKAWSDNLERYADLANRLPRGRAYLRNGSVLDLSIAGGQVEAYVAGSELYRVTIGIAPLAKMRWRRVIARCTGRIGSLVGLLRGELSDDVLAVLTHAKDGLFPEPREMTLDCSCPDSATVCKHVAAVLYGVGTRLDARPELFFLLRQVDQAELLSSATTATVSRARPERHPALALLPERRGQRLRAAHAHIPLRGDLRNVLEVPIAGEHCRRGFLTPAGQTGVAVRAVAHEREPVGDRCGRDTELLPHGRLVA